ncbi:MAG: uroporphyrinogen decarboxylase [Desulfovibrionaceae bacterium]|jgi:uroporphyrinogen decarboxylase|nr:uroporphyrinogen decarboxylase [Desulfovibrionaceae bacterium]
MTRTERVRAALAKQDVDRIPISIWLHYSHLDQDPRSLAEEQVRAARKFDYDFIKLMPFGLYSVQDWGPRLKMFCQKGHPPIVDRFAIDTPEDWLAVKELPGTYGAWGSQVTLAKHVRRLVGDEIPFIQTIFSPLTSARKLGGERIFEDMKNCPEALHAALEAITRTTVSFIRENLAAGVSGFFFATQNAVSTEISPEAYEEFGAAYDLRLFEAFAGQTWLDVIHIHGENVMFKRVAEYPGNCINWHDRWGGPSMDKARALTDKCLLGGLNERDVLHTVDTDAVQAHVAEAVAMAGRTGLMIGPGCVADPATPEANFFAARMALENL